MLACPPAGVLGALILTALHPQHSHRSTVRCCALLDARAPQLDPDPDVAFLLSGFEARALLKLRGRAPATGGAAIAGPHSIDLGASSAASLLVTTDGVALRSDGDPESSPSAASVTWAELKRIERKGGAYKCYLPHLGYAVDKVEGFSDETQRAASLLPLDGAHATVTLGGFSMHRFAKAVDPGQDTQAKLHALGPALRGDMLDVCTGLGYTAIAAARCERVASVTTIELDPLMVRMQRENPWSRELFAQPKISRLLGDATELVPLLPAEGFDCAVHDPPAQAMAGELYSASLYAALRRALRSKGVLYHYIGDPSSKASGKLFKGVKQRLLDAGFSEVRVDSAAYGVVATVP